MTTAQINARIDAGIKSLGDEALSSVGYSPTKAVRALWGFASRNARNPKSLRALLDKLEEDGSQSAHAEAVDWESKIAEGPLIIERALLELGIQSHTPSGVSDEELLYRAHREKMVERGLL
ncbi:MAG: hypothetical protein IJ111_11955 [Eggerthellaceae bacterium]|nr:hypothetical protein [Eggerthellaceae bacterium]